MPAHPAHASLQASEKVRGAYGRLEAVQQKLQTLRGTGDTIPVLHREWGHAFRDYMRAIDEWRATTKWR